MDDCWAYGVVKPGAGAVCALERTRVLSPPDLTNALRARPPRRRGGLPLAGCLDATPSLRGNCDAATDDPEGVSPAGYQPEGETVAPFRDYLCVEVEATADDVPDLRGRIESCDGSEDVRRSVPGTARHAFEFGPFGHHCVQEYEFRLESCR